MAFLDRERTGIFQLGFTYGGKRFKRSLRTRDEATAEAALHRVEENLRLVASGRLAIPADADLATFLISDGKLTSSTQVAPKQLRVGELFETYAGGLPEGALAAETLRIAAIHMRHVVRIVGSRKLLRTVKRDDVQHEGAPKGHPNFLTWLGDIGKLLAEIKEREQLCLVKLVVNTLIRTKFRSCMS